MRCHLLRKLGSFEVLVMFFFLSSCFLTIKRSISNYPLHTAKLYGLSECVDHVLLKSNKILFFVFFFLVFLQDQIGEGIVSIILGQSPVQEYKVNPPKNKITSSWCWKHNNSKILYTFVTYKVMEINGVNFPLI